MQATNPKNGESAPRAVAAVWHHQDGVYEFRTDDGATVASTEDHPFWNVTEQEWQQAQQFGQGDRLYKADKQSLRVVGLDLLAGRSLTAYNLTIRGIHTYYVMLGRAAVLVHNHGGSLASRDGASLMTRRFTTTVDKRGALP